MKAIAIARVSSTEQEIDGQSLDAQQERLLRYIKDKDLDLIHPPYQIVESSTQGARKKFMKILDDSVQENETLAIVVDKVDRFQRTFKETVYCDDLIKKGLLEIHFVNDNLLIHKESMSSDILRWNMCVFTAQAVVLTISDNVKRTYEYKLAHGEAIGKLPTGYLNIRQDNGRGKIVGTGKIDPFRGPLVKEVFELYSTASYSYRSLAKVMRQKGLTTNTKREAPVSKRAIEDMVHNPIYYGYQEIKGVLHRHSFGDIISKELFDECQLIIDGKGSYAIRPDNNMPFVFRGLIKCGKCGRYCSPYSRKGHNYVRCTQLREDCPNPNISEKELFNQLKDVFKNLVIPKEVMLELEKDLKATHEGKILYEKEVMDKTRRVIDNYTSQLDELLNMRLDKSITQEQYDKKALEIIGKRKDQYELLERITIADENFANLMIKLLDISSRAWEIFESSSIDKKKQLLGLITLNLTLDDKKLYVELQKPFDAIYNYNKSGKWGE